VALIRTDVSEDRIASIFRVHECEQVTERSCKLLYRERLVVYSSIQYTTNRCLYKSLQLVQACTGNDSNIFCFTTASQLLLCLDN
jgi:hypothetical protein